MTPTQANDLLAVLTRIATALEQPQKKAIADRDALLNYLWWVAPMLTEDQNDRVNDVRDPIHLFYANGTLPTRFRPVPDPPRQPWYRRILGR